MVHSWHISQCLFLHMSSLKEWIYSLKYSLQQPDCQNDRTGWDHTGLPDDSLKLLCPVSSLSETSRETKRHGSNCNQILFYLIFSFIKFRFKLIKETWSLCTSTHTRAQTYVYTVWMSVFRTRLVYVTSRGAADRYCFCILTNLSTVSRTWDLWDFTDASGLERYNTCWVDSEADCVLTNRLHFPAGHSAVCGCQRASLLPFICCVNWPSVGMVTWSWQIWIKDLWDFEILSVLVNVSKLAGHEMCNVSGVICIPVCANACVWWCMHKFICCFHSSKHVAAFAHNQLPFFVCLHVNWKDEK